MFAGEIQARLREAASLEKHVLLKKLRDALESLKGRVAGRNKDDVVDAISMVSSIFIGKIHALFAFIPNKHNFILTLICV